MNLSYCKTLQYATDKKIIHVSIFLKAQNCPAAAAAPPEEITGQDSWKTQNERLAE
jgi:hypothetical protein